MSIWRQICMHVMLKLDTIQQICQMYNYVYLLSLTLTSPSPPPPTPNPYSTPIIFLNPNCNPNCNPICTKEWRNLPLKVCTCNTSVCTVVTCLLLLGWKPKTSSMKELYACEHLCLCPWSQNVLWVRFT